MKLTERKTRLTFETADEVRDRGKHRQVIIEAQPTHAVLRLKGTRQKMLVSWAGIYNFACIAQAAKLAAEKRAMKKEKRLRRRVK